MSESSTVLLLKFPTLLLCYCGFLLL